MKGRRREGQQRRKAALPVGKAGGRREELAGMLRRDREAGGRVAVTTYYSICGLGHDIRARRERGRSLAHEGRLRYAANGPRK